MKFKAFPPLQKFEEAKPGDLLTAWTPSHRPVIGIKGRRLMPSRDIDDFFVSLISFEPNLPQVPTVLPNRENDPNLQRVLNMTATHELVPDRSPGAWLSHIPEDDRTGCVFGRGSNHYMAVACEPDSTVMNYLNLADGMLEKTLVDRYVAVRSWSIYEVDDRGERPPIFSYPPTS